MRRGLVALAMLGAAWAVNPAAAVARPATVAIDGSEAQLSAQDGGGWTATVGVTNLTDGPVTLSARPADAADAGCTPSLRDGALPPAQHRTVTVVVPAGCKVASDGFTFELTTHVHPAGAPLSVTATKPTPAPRPDWAQLHWFWRILAIVLVVTLILGLGWVSSDEGHNWNTPLLGLDRSWSFSDSWATNVTAVGGLLAAFFTTSGVTSAILGSDADSALGLLTVGSAIAVGMAAAGPVVVLATKTRASDALTPFGLFVGAALTISAAGGELWIAYRTGTRLDLGGVDTPLLILLILAGLLLVVYAFRTLRQTLDAGIVPPEGTAQKRRRAVQRVAEGTTARVAALPHGLDFVTSPELLRAAVENETNDALVEYEQEPQRPLRRRAAVL